MSPPFRRLIFLAAGLIFAVCLQAREITVVTDINYPPYSFLSSDGELQGILVDQWRLWETKTGIKVHLKGLDWALALEAVNSGHADVIDTIFQTPERNKIYDFSDAYATIKVPVFHSSEIAGIQNPRDLRGFLVGVKKGDSDIGQLQALGVKNLKEYDSYEAMIDDAAEGLLPLFCMDEPPALYLLYKKNIASRFRQAFYLSSGEFHRAVPKGSIVLTWVNNGFRQISEAENSAILQRWLGRPLTDPDTPKYLWFLIAGVGFLSLVLGIFIFILRRMVSQKTSELAGTIEKLKSSEERATALLGALPDLFFILDGDGRFLEYHAQDQSRLYAPPEVFLNRNVREVLPLNIAEQLIRVLDQLKAGGPGESFEYELRQGAEIHYFENRTLAFGPNRYLSIIRDISDSRNLREASIRANKLESVGLLAGGIAHDFNNILTAVLGNIALIRMEALGESRVNSYCDVMEKAILRARSLTTQLLTFAKGSRPTMAWTDLRRVAVEAASFSLTGSPCVLEVEAPDELYPARIDADQIAQVFQNLVLNAVQAMPRGGRIRLVFDRVESDGLPPGLNPDKSYYRISVQDQGQGISQENLPRIFDPYFTTKNKGSGLGLSICYSIMASHQGTLTVESEWGKGTTFHGYFPIEPLPPLSVPSTQVPKPLTSYAGLSVLVMDDEEMIRELVKEMLDNLGAHCQFFPEGKQAWESFQKQKEWGQPYNLVITDLTVPGGMGGVELARNLRKEGSEVAIIVFTGYSDSEASHDENLFDAFLKKPFLKSELQDALEQALRKRSGPRVLTG